MKRKRLLFFALLFVIIVGIIIVSTIVSKRYTGSETLEEALELYSPSMRDYAENHLIEKVNIDDYTVLIFFLNPNYDTVYYSLIEKQKNGNWTVLATSSLSTKKHPGETNPYSYSGILSEKFNGFWGVIFDQDIETLVLEANQEDNATVIQSPHCNPIWFKVYKKSQVALNDVKSIKAIDANGNEVPWDIFEIQNNTPKAALESLHQEKNYAEILEIYEEVNIDDEREVFVYKGLENNEENIFIALIEHDSRKWRVTEAQNIGLPTSENLNKEIQTEQFIARYITPSYEAVKDQDERIVKINDDFFVWFKVYPKESVYW